MFTMPQAKSLRARGISAARHLTETPPARHIAPVTSAPRTPTALAAEMYLLVFPAGHLLVRPVGGPIATAADVALLALLLAWGWDLATRRGLTVLPPARVLGGLALLVALGLWVAASALWGPHALYAAGKGAGLLGLGLGAIAMATSGLTWRRAADAWLGGAGVALALTLVVGVAGPDILRERMFLGGTGIVGLPFPRISGPFLHPNMMGDYLVVSGLLLWGRWPAWVRRARAPSLVFAAALGGGLVLTASTAWVGVGVAAMWLGGRAVRAGRRALGAALLVGGLAVAGGMTVLLVLPLDLHVFGLDLTTGAIRPDIWRSSLAAFVASPLVGVGAAPFLAEAADRLHGGVVGLWDAHNAYLSVVGQFGLVGGALAAGGVGLVASGALRLRAGAPGRSRAQLAVGLALLAVAVDGVFLAAEDLRHVWGLMGVAGVVASDPGPGKEDRA